MRQSLIALAVLAPAYCWALYSNLSDEQARNFAAIRAAQIALYTPTITPTIDRTPRTITPTITPTATATATPTATPKP